MEEYILSMAHLSSQPRDYLPLKSSDYSTKQPRDDLPLKSSDYSTKQPRDYLPLKSSDYLPTEPSEPPLKKLCSNKLDTEFRIEHTRDGFANLISFILKEFPYIEKIIYDNYSLFDIFIRPDENIERLFYRMYKDLESLEKKKVDICRHGYKCERIECCAFLHGLDINNIKNPYKRLQLAINDFISHKKDYNSSRVMRHLQELNIGIWNTLSRKNRGEYNIRRK
jgi:hypothetical protein